jgi:hypothetical protein
VSDALGRMTDRDLVILLGEFDAILDGSRRLDPTDRYLQVHGARWRAAVSDDRFAAMEILDRNGNLPEPWKSELDGARAIVAQIMGGAR